MRSPPETRAHTLRPRHAGEDALVRDMVTSESLPARSHHGHDFDLALPSCWKLTCRAPLPLDLGKAVCHRPVPVMSKTTPLAPSCVEDNLGAISQPNALQGQLSGFPRWPVMTAFVWTACSRGRKHGPPGHPAPSLHLTGVPTPCPAHLVEAGGRDAGPEPADWSSEVTQPQPHHQTPSWARSAGGRRGVGHTGEVLHLKLFILKQLHR